MLGGLDESIVTILEFAGIVAFAASGSLLAVRKDFDLIGVLSLGTATALGGGFVRDLVIADGTPAAFSDPWLLPTALAAAVAAAAAHRLWPAGIGRCSSSTRSVSDCSAWPVPPSLLKLVSARSPQCCSAWSPQPVAASPRHPLAGDAPDLPSRLDALRSACRTRLDGHSDAPRRRSRRSLRRTCNGGDRDHRPTHRVAFGLARAVSGASRSGRVRRSRRRACRAPGRCPWRRPVPGSTTHTVRHRCGTEAPRRSSWCRTASGPSTRRRSSRRHRSRPRASRRACRHRRARYGSSQPLPGPFIEARILSPSYSTEVSSRIVKVGDTTIGLARVMLAVQSGTSSSDMPSTVAARSSMARAGRTLR